jgi:hypothetical protein
MSVAGCYYYTLKLYLSKYAEHDPIYFGSGDTINIVINYVS